MVNFCLGTGFLGVPYSFFYSGYLAAVPTLALAAFVTWLSSTWLLEVMARAQVSSVCTELVLIRHQPKLVVTYCQNRRERSTREMAKLMSY